MANRVLFGRFPDGTMGLRVSKPGHNVLDMGLAPKNVAFDSRWPRAFRVHMSGSAYTPAPGAATTVYFGRSFAQPPHVMIARTHAFDAGRYIFVADNLQVFNDRFEYRLAGNFPFSYYVVVP